MFAMTFGIASPASLRGKFLLASPSLADPNFARAVVLIVRHDLDGALGLVLNRPLGVTLDEACSDEVDAARGVGVPLFHGGPCTGPLVAVHNLDLLARAEASLGVDAEEDEEDDEQTIDEPATTPVVPGVYFCSRREALEALMRHLGSGPDDLEHTAVKFVAGYAGWGGGQLEQELSDGAWQLMDAEARHVYAGGDERHPPPEPDAALPPGAIGMINLLDGELPEDAPDPSAALAAGVRQWVRLSTRANLSKLIDPRRIPPDPSRN
jgi:putative transcriptional regulator